MGLKTILPVSGEVSTTDTTWTTIATCAVPNDCSIAIEGIFAIGKTTNGTVGETTYMAALHKAKKVSGTLSLIGSLVYLMTANSGSDTAVKTASIQMVVSGSNLLLQVKGIAARNIDWFGGFTLILN